MIGSVSSAQHLHKNGTNPSYCLRTKGLLGFFLEFLRYVHDALNRHPHSFPYTMVRLHKVWQRQTWQHRNAFPSSCSKICKIV